MSNTNRFVLKRYRIQQLAPHDYTVSIRHALWWYFLLLLRCAYSIAFVCILLVDVHVGLAFLLFPFLLESIHLGLLYPSALTLRELLDAFLFAWFRFKSFDYQEDAIECVALEKHYDSSTYYL